MSNMSFFYDGQIRKYLIQLIRVFSHFEVSENTQNGVQYNRVPCKYANASRMVAQIIRGNSENIMNSAPQITVGLQNIALSRERSQEPFYEDRRQVAEREWNADEKSYTSEQGNLYTLERYMPVPYDLTIQVDIWTTNTNSKLQLLEQILVLFNPSIQLQVNDNPLDWGNVFELNLTDISWTSRSIPQGTEDTLDIATLTFDVPIWISPPAKVTRQKIIQKIVADIHSVSNIDELDYNEAFYDFFSEVPTDSRVVITPKDYEIFVEGNTVTLINSSDVVQDWNDLIEMQGEITNASLMELNLSDDINNRDILAFGQVSKSSTSSELIFDLDEATLPANTLDDVDQIIDPRASYPDNGLPSVSPGQRYLILEDVSQDFISSGNIIWGINAQAGSILEYSGTDWFVDFDTNYSGNAWVTTSSTGKQFTWTGSEWISSWEGQYRPGYWRLIL